MHADYFLLTLLSFALFGVIYCEEPSASNESFLKPYLNRRYKLATSDDNFDEVMKRLGVSFMLRQLAHLAKPVIELTEDSGVYTLTQKSVFKNTAISFRIGEMFEETTPDDRKVKSLITQDHNTLTQVQHGGKEVTTITRVFTPDAVKVTVKVDNIVSVRTYAAE